MSRRTIVGAGLVVLVGLGGVGMLVAGEEGMWGRIKAFFASDEPAPAGASLADPPGEPVVITIRNLEIARKFPQELPDDPVGTPSHDHPSCPRDHVPLRRVVITTGGPLGDPATWEAYPLALDGFECPTCGEVTYPVFLSTEEELALDNGGVASAQGGAFDDAEYAFRRVTSSWPTYMPVRVNFGAMLIDRIKAEQKGANRPEVVERYAQMAEAQLRKALTCEPPAPPQARFMLGRLLIGRGQRDEGARFLQQVVDSSETSPAMRDAASKLLSEAPPPAP